jgi:branched-chain amino acid transport system permease protein
MKENTIGILGRRIHYLFWGEGIPVLLVHGNTGSCRWWTRVPGVAGALFVAPDLPNFGKSDRLDEAEAPAASDIDRYADYVIALAQALELDRPILVGHSLGGAVAISALCRRPELWRSAVLVDSAPPTGLVTPEAHYAAIEAFKTDRNLLRSALAAVCPTLDDPGFLDKLTDDAWRMNPASFAGNARALARFNRSAECGAYKGRVTVVWGRKDVIVTEAMARQTAGAFPSGELQILENVGHSAMIEDPEGFRGILAQAVADSRS